MAAVLPAGWSDVLINDEYRIIRKFACGGYGAVYLGTCVSSGEQVAVKTESEKERKPVLLIESQFYEILDGGFGIPKLRWYGHANDCNVLVMDALGPSLDDLFAFCCRKFTMKNVLMLVDQMISRLEYVHNKSIVHRDIQPDNFRMGIGIHCTKVFLANYGLAKKYVDSMTLKHIPYKERQLPEGTLEYMSINTHCGIEPSRRDDLESIGYVLVYFLRGKLPWQDVKDMAQRREKILEQKMATPPHVLCKSLPDEFTTYMMYCRVLRFDETPDYKYLRQLFRTLFEKLKYQYDYMYDWSLIKRKVEIDLDADRQGTAGNFGGGK